MEANTREKLTRWKQTRGEANTVHSGEQPAKARTEERSGQSSNYLLMELKPSTPRTFDPMKQRTHYRR